MHQQYQCTGTIAPAAVQPGRRRRFGSAPHPTIPSPNPNANPNLHTQAGSDWCDDAQIQPQPLPRASRVSVTDGMGSEWAVDSVRAEELPPPEVGSPASLAEFRQQRRESRGASDR